MTLEVADTASMEPTSTVEQARETPTMMFAVEPALTTVVDVLSKLVPSETSIVARAAP